MKNIEAVSDSPEKFANFSSFLSRQFSKPPPPIDKNDVDLKGQTFIVTGANSGIGFECSRQLLDLGLTKLIMACRNESKAGAAKTQLMAGRGPGVEIEVWPLDLASYDSIINFTDRCKSLDRVDAAILNAGVSNDVLVKTQETGCEEIFQVNYISTMLLCVLLLPVFKGKSSPEKPGRIVIVSSDTAAWTTPPDAKSGPILPPFKQPAKFNRSNQYDTSKLFGQIFICELARQIPASAALLVLANPGLCRETGLSASGKTIEGRLFSILARVLGKEPAVGAITLIKAATADLGTTAQDQLIDCSKLAPLAPVLYKPEGKELAKILWEETIEELSFASVVDVIEELKK